VKSIVSLSSYYPVNWLAKFQIYGYIRYPDIDIRTNPNKNVGLMMWAITQDT